MNWAKLSKRNYRCRDQGSPFQIESVDFPKLAQLIIPFYYIHKCLDFGKSEKLKVAIDNGENRHLKSTDDGQNGEPWETALE